MMYTIFIYDLTTPFDISMDANRTIVDTLDLVTTLFENGNKDKLNLTMMEKNILFIAKWKHNFIIQTI